MKSICVYSSAVALACSALLISSADAGGRHHFGLSSSSASTRSITSTNLSGGPIGGYVGPRTPLPPLKAPPSTTNTASLTAKPATTGGQGTATQSGSATNHSTKVIFTPPPTFVGVPPSVNGPVNAAAANRAVDGTFGGSIMNTGLTGSGERSKPNSDLPEVAQVHGIFLPSVVPVGHGPQGPPTRNTMGATVTQEKPGVLVDLPTSASTKAKSAVTAATGGSRP